MSWCARHNRPDNRNSPCFDCLAEASHRDLLERNALDQTAILRENAARDAAERERRSAQEEREDRARLEAGKSAAATEAENRRLREELARIAGQRTPEAVRRLEFKRCIESAKGCLVIAELDSAAEQLRQAAALLPTEPELFDVRADLFRSQGDPERERAAAEKACRVELTPERAVRWAALLPPGEAVATLAEAWSRWPGHPDLTLELVVALLRDGRPEEAAQRSIVATCGRRWKLEWVRDGVRRSLGPDAAVAPVFVCLVDAEVARLTALEREEESRVEAERELEAERKRGAEEELARAMAVQRQRREREEEHLREEARQSAERAAAAAAADRARQTRERVRAEELRREEEWAAAEAAERPMARILAAGALVTDGLGDAARGVARGAKRNGEAVAEVVATSFSWALIGLVFGGCLASGYEDFSGPGRYDIVAALFKPDVEIMDTRCGIGCAYGAPRGAGLGAALGFLYALIRRV